MSTQVGTLLSGRFRLDAKVGHGGMSTVFRAFDQVLERQVAIKVMHREIAGDSDQLERFRREARAVAQLNHPHIVGVIDAGEAAPPDSPEGHPMVGTPFIVFEYVEGETLKQRIRRLTRLPIGEAVAYAIEIARALGAAHERGIVHRDVKPQNVLVDEEGSAKVTDFGIARTLDQDGLTADGRVLGTTDYVSPEQALGHVVTGQSDLYSLGVVLFEMLTGDVPFHGENQVAVAMKHVREELPDVQVRRPEVSSALAAVLDRLTAKDLGRRHASASELVADLEEVLTIEAARAGQTTGEATAVLRTISQPARERVPGRVLHPARWLVPLLLVLVAAGVAGAFLLAGDRVERGTGSRNTPPPTDAPDLRAVSLQQRGAQDFDPEGGDGEHPEAAGRVIDGDPGTYWYTETYEAFTKEGVGVYVDADPGVQGRQLRIRTSTPGWKGQVLVADSGPPEELADWTPAGEVDASRRTTEIALDVGGRPRYYLVWVTDLGKRSSVRINELSLFR